MNRHHLAMTAPLGIGFFIAGYSSDTVMLLAIGLFLASYVTVPVSLWSAGHGAMAVLSVLVLAPVIGSVWCLTAEYRQHLHGANYVLLDDDVHARLMEKAAAGETENRAVARLLEEEVKE